MSGKIIPLLTDRSAAELDDKCGMAYWWNRHYGEKGIVPASEPEALAVGAATHEDMALLGELPDLSPQSLGDHAEALLSRLSDDEKCDQHRMEVLYRRVGWFLAWGLFKEPEIRSGWTNVGIERELILDRSPLWLQVTPDRVLRNKETGRLKYMEYKSTISASKKWLESWRYQIQIHSSLQAVNEEIGEAGPVHYGQVVGLLKGSYSMSDNRLTHPYVWGYYNDSTGAWTHDYSKARSAGWSPRPIWEYPGGVLEWVERCGKECACNIFPSTAPIFLDSRMLDNWIARRTAREQQVRIVKETAKTNEAIRNVYFEQRTNRCKPGFGDACPYLSICWNADRGRDPLSTGDFVERTPHHDLEVIGVD